MDSGGLASQVQHAAVGCYPFGFLTELKQLLKLAWPTVLVVFLPLTCVYIELELKSVKLIID